MGLFDDNTSNLSSHNEFGFEHHHDAEGWASNLQQGLSWARKGASLGARINHVLTSSGHSAPQLNNAMNSHGLLCFKLISSLLISFYTVFRLISDPTKTDATKIAQLLQSHLVLMLVVIALLCPVTSVPIAFILSANDFITASFELFAGYQNLLNLQKLATQATGQPQQRATLQQRMHTQHKLNHELLQKMLLTLLGIMGIALTLVPGAQLAGAIFLLASTTGGIATQLPWQHAKQSISQTFGLFTGKAEPATDLVPRHCVPC